MAKIRRVAVVPTLLTLGNLLSGFAAIERAFSALHSSGQIDLERLVQAAMLCFVAMVFDMLDGLVARLTHTTSPFGAELDSLADLTSFGVAPAVVVMVLLHNWGGMDRYTGVLLAAYVAFGALRLARYNVEGAQPKRSTPARKPPPPMHFSGLPIPAACGAVMSTIILVEYVHREGGWIGTHWPWFLSIILMALPFLMLLLGLLMVSRVPYAHLAKMFLAGKRPFAYLTAVIVTTVLVFLHHEVTLFVGFQAYVGYGLLRVALGYLRRRPKTAEEEAGVKAPQ